MATDESDTAQRTAAGFIFYDDLRALLNRYSVENESNTPDFILANYIQDCLDAYKRAVNRRESWHVRPTT
jgi:hypothetical protein